MMLEHGGKRIYFAEKYQIAQSDWLDLSTGVSPFTYPCQAVDMNAWHRLPENDDGLELAAANYYGCAQLLAIAGSQAGIMCLPKIVANLRSVSGQNSKQAKVALPAIGYQEHQHAWHGKTGRWQRQFYQDLPSISDLEQADVLVVINPNNPTGKLIDGALLVKWQAQLAQRGAYLIIDEAFIDCSPEQSLLNYYNDNLPDNLIVLRSVGKFFGLAGARVGFLFASLAIREAVANKLGPWTLSGPSRQIVKIALNDNAWQYAMREQLQASAEQLKQLLAQFFSESRITGTDLFQRVSLSITDAKRLHHQLCQQGILTRLCDELDAIRFGLPKNNQEFKRLEQALQLSLAKNFSQSQLTLNRSL